MCLTCGHVLRQGVRGYTLPALHHEEVTYPGAQLVTTPQGYRMARNQSEARKHILSPSGRNIYIDGARYKQLIKLGYVHNDDSTTSPK